MLNNISVNYGAIHALRDISFTLNEGEIVALIGANGAGKSTSLNTISGLLHPTLEKWNIWARTSQLSPARHCEPGNYPGA